MRTRLKPTGWQYPPTFAAVRTDAAVVALMAELRKDVVAARRTLGLTAP